MPHEQVKVIEAPRSPNVVDPDLGERRPLVFDPTTRTIYVGDEGWHHTNIESTYDIPDHGLNYGWIGSQPGYQNQHSDVGWYRTMAPSEDNQVAINEALGRELGVRTKTVDDDSWHFGGALIGDVLDWDEGFAGKGLIDTSDNFHTWNVSEYPFHQDYMDANGIYDAFLYVTIDPNGAVLEASGDLLLPEYKERIESADPRLWALEKSIW